MQIKSKLHSTTSFLHNILKIKFYITIVEKWSRIHVFCEVFHYSNIELFGGNKTIQWQLACPASDIGKSTGPRSSTGENSGGPMKTLIVLVLLSGKKNCCRESLNGDSNDEKKLGPVKVLEDQ